MDRILVLDFGGQYNQLIARRVRDLGVFAEIEPYSGITAANIKERAYSGIIFTGGPNSVYDSSSPRCDREILETGIPVLGICYGAQLIAYLCGGEVSGAETSSEYGKTVLRTEKSVIFEGVPDKSICWMSHTDYISRVPDGFISVAYTDKCPCAAMSDGSGKIHAVQFHPEVTHTEYGMEILGNFLFRV